MRFFGFDEAGEVHDGFAQGFTVSGEDGLVPDDDDLGTVIDQAPESVGEPDALLDDEVHEVMGKCIAVAGEVPFGLGPVRADDVDEIVLARPAGERSGEESVHSSATRSSR